MKNWYSAVCDTHKEFCSIMVDSPAGTIPFLSEESNIAIKEWMVEHSCCKVRIISQDEDLDFLFENNYLRKVNLS